MPSQMRFRLLGRAGLRVSEYGLGTMTFGEEWGWGASPAESRRMFDAYVARGGNFLDTSNNYTDGTSERLVGEFVHTDRDRFVVATKFSLSDHPGDPNASGNHRKNLMRSVQGSLRRLGTDYVDLLWLHMWDGTTRIDEVMRGLDDLVRMGDVHYVGVSDTPAWVVSQANMLADLRGWSPFVALQLRYGLTDRTAERELLPMARALDLAVTPWSILGAGVLSGKYNPGAAGSAEGRASAKAARIERNIQIAEAVTAVAREAGVAPTQVAIAWVRQQPGVVIPLLGARNLEQLEDNLGAVGFALSAEQVAGLDEISQIEPGFPHDFLASEGIRKLMSGDTHHRQDRHR